VVFTEGQPRGAWTIWLRFEPDADEYESLDPGSGHVIKIARRLALKVMAFCRNTQPRNRPDFVKNGGNVRGPISQLPSKIASVCDTRCLKDTPA